MVAAPGRGGLLGLQGRHTVGSVDAQGLARHVQVAPGLLAGRQARLGAGQVGHAQLAEQRIAFGAARAQLVEQGRQVASAGQDFQFADPVDAHARRAGDQHLRVAGQRHAVEFDLLARQQPVVQARGHCALLRA